MSNEPIEGEVLNSMPAVTPVTGQQVALSTTDNPYLAMAQMAMQTGKVDQLDKLLDLQLRWDGEQARKAFVAAMAMFKCEPIHIAKAKRVSFQTSKGKTEYDHAELVDVTNAIVPAMAKHGISHRWAVKQEGSAITVACILTHRDGHSETVTMTAPPDDSGGKNTIQGIASTKTYLERYTLLAATGIATGGEIDADGRQEEKQIQYITEEQEIILRDLIDAYVKNKAKFMEWVSSRVGFKVEKLMEIPSSSYSIVHAQLSTLSKEQANAS